MGEINVLHPFREGNGRTQREFIGQLARENGYRINWDGVSQSDMINASIEAYRGSSERLGRLIRANMIDLEAERVIGDAEFIEPSLEEQLEVQSPALFDEEGLSLDQQLKSQEASAAPLIVRRAETDADEPRMDM